MLGFLMPLVGWQPLGLIGSGTQLIAKTTSFLSNVPGRCCRHPFHKCTAHNRSIGTPAPNLTHLLGTGDPKTNRNRNR